MKRRRLKTEARQVIDVDPAPEGAGRRGTGPEPGKRNASCVMKEQKQETRVQGKASWQAGQNIP